MNDMKKESRIKKLLIRDYQDIPGECGILENVGECWRMLDNVGECWIMLDNVGECWIMLENVGELNHEFRQSEASPQSRSSLATDLNRVSVCPLKKHAREYTPT